MAASNRPTADPFWWEEGPDGIRLRCAHFHGNASDLDTWAGPWRDDLAELRSDEAAHECDRAVRWRHQRKEDPRAA